MTCYELVTWQVLLPSKASRIIIYLTTHVGNIRRFLLDTDWETRFPHSSARPEHNHARNLIVPGPERQFTLFKEISLNVSLIRSGFRFQLLEVVSFLTATGLVPSVEAKYLWCSLTSALDRIPGVAWYHHGFPPSRQADRNWVYRTFVLKLCAELPARLTQCYWVSRAAFLNCWRCEDSRITMAERTGHGCYCFEVGQG